MKRTAILTLLAAAALFAADATSGPQPQIPRKSPEFSIQMRGKQVTLGQYKGYICAVAFMSTTCPHCQHLAQVLAGLQQEYSSKGVQVLGAVINPEAITDLPNFTAVFARNMFPIGMSTEAMIRPYLQHPPGITYFPMMVFIDKQGIIRAEHLGATEPNFFNEAMETQNIRFELDAILKEPAIKVPDGKKK